MILVDTDVLIWYLRGNEHAARTLGGLDGFSLSAITYMELVQGMRNKDELRVLRAALRNWGIEVHPVTEPVSTRATFYVEEHFLSHSLRLADALIAATAVVNGMPLLTADTKHYQVITNLALNRFEPQIRA